MVSAIFPGRYESLAKISEFVEEAAVQAGLDDKAVYAVQTAVDEACSNIIEHAYGGEGIGDIFCTCIITDKGLKIQLKDFGRPFNPDLVPEPDLKAELENIKIGGLGLHFIRKLMDEVHFEFGGEKGNTLTMAKHKE